MHSCNFIAGPFCHHLKKTSSKSLLTFAIAYWRKRVLELHTGKSRVYKSRSTRILHHPLQHFSIHFSELSSPWSHCNWGGGGAAAERAPSYCAASSPSRAWCRWHPFSAGSRLLAPESSEHVLLPQPRQHHPSAEITDWVYILKNSTRWAIQSSIEQWTWKLNLGTYFHRGKCEDVDGKHVVSHVWEITHADVLIPTISPTNI